MLPFYDFNYSIKYYVNQVWAATKCWLEMIAGWKFIYIKMFNWPCLTYLSIDEHYGKPFYYLIYKSDIWFNISDILYNI